MELPYLTQGFLKAETLPPRSAWEFHRGTDSTPFTRLGLSQLRDDASIIGWGFSQDQKLGLPGDSLALETRCLWCSHPLERILNHPYGL